MTASHDRTRTTLRAWSMPVTIGMVTQRLASVRLNPGSTPTTMPPPSAAPRDAASITPARPPHRSTAPAAASAAPTRSAARVLARDATPSPITPMWSATGGDRSTRGRLPVECCPETGTGLAECYGRPGGQMASGRLIILVGGLVLLVALVASVGLDAVTAAFATLSWRLAIVAVMPFMLGNILDTLGWRFAFTRDV